MIEYISPSEGAKRNGSQQRNYTVTWEASLSATNFVEAAKQAKISLSDPENKATCFVVKRNGTEEIKVVDFELEETLDDPNTPDNI